MLKVFLLLPIGFNNKQVYYVLLYILKIKVKIKYESLFENKEMKLVICIIIERDSDALLLAEQNSGRGYWFPYDEIKPGEVRVVAAKRIANKVNIHSIIYLKLSVHYTLDRFI